jgi:NAD(P)-dependent dehydrogenase (short-subunit alcohol dehydrogenase family)
VLVTGGASGVGAVGTGPDDIARMALFLGADDSAMCTAQDFIVDGGWV